MARRTSHQQRIIRNYYENRDTLMLQSLQEVVSELYLASNERRRAQLWQRAETALQKFGIAPAEVARIVKSHDLTALAKVVSREF